jgi:hypothetical protein
MILPGIFASQISGHLYSGPAGAFDALGSVTVGSGGQSSITFSAIPQTYTHLQIRAIFRNNSYSGGGAEENLRLQFNSDTNSNYSDHWLVGDGSSASASNELTSSILVAYGIIPMSNATANIYGTSVIDILDFGNTFKYKTTRALSGRDNNGSGYSFLSSGSWRNTNAVTSINIYPQAGAFAQYTNISLYGIR